ncbi:MAG: SAM-dependent methyltransferase, partial [Desulfobacterales bacterium]
MPRWRDHYSKRAKLEQYPARSVYKLKEAQKKYRLIKKGDQILDLGCAPGSWTLFAAKLIGKQGKVLGIDREAVTHAMPPQAKTLIADVMAI